MIGIKNSEVITHVMNSFFNVTSTKTSAAHAWLTLKILLQKLEYKYDFLRNVSVKDINYINAFLKEIIYHQTNYNVVSVHSDIVDSINQKKVGQAIQSFADELMKYLGKEAGYHFLREFRDDLGGEYHLILRTMGVDLRLIELQDELYGLISEHYSIEDDSELNIAYVEKK